MTISTFRIPTPLSLVLLLTACPGNDATSGSSSSGEPGTSSGGSTSIDPTSGGSTSEATPTTTGPTTTTTDTTATDTTATDTTATDTTAAPTSTTDPGTDTTDSSTGTATDTTAAESTSTGAAPVCGDGIVDDAEVCDDGNQTENDGCSTTCTVACSSLQFTGTAPARAADPAGLHAASITLATWYRADDIDPYGGLVGKAGGSLGGHITYNLGASATVLTSRLQTSVEPPLFLDINAQKATFDGAWHHLAITYDAASGEGTLYLDGVKVGGGNQGKGLVASDPAYPFVVGAAPLSMSEYEFPSQADLADIVVYDKALTPDELAELIAGEVPPGPLALYHAREGSGATSEDASGNGHELTQVPEGGWRDDNPYCPDRCGDASVDPGESCDDDNEVDGDGCTAACEFECTSLHFAGQTISIAAEPAALHVTSVTAAAWYKAEAGAPYGGILGKQGNVDGGHLTYSLAAGMNGVTARLQTGLNPLAFLDLTDPGAESDGTWHHIAVTYDEADGAGALYVDGVMVDSDMQGAGLVAENPALRFAVGATPIGAMDSEFRSQADITEVVVYATAMDSVGIMGLVEGDYPPGALAYYPTVEGMGTMSADASGNDHTLEVANLPITGWAKQGPACGP